jgi:hypothetical protein
MAALKMLQNICLTKENRGLVVGLGICDPLTVIARNDDLAVLREVASTVNCLSSWEQNSHEICDRTVNTLVAMLISTGDSSRFIPISTTP